MLIEFCHSLIGNPLISISEESGESSQRFLPLHVDQSTHSVVIALNPTTDYEGGGTYFSAISTVLSLDVGCMLTFPGSQLLHGGEPIAAGVRYILTMFLFLGKEPGISDRQVGNKRAQLDTHVEGRNVLANNNSDFISRNGTEIGEKTFSFSFF